MKRSEKEAFVAGFQERVKASPVLYLTDFTGLDVKSITRLRHDLKAAGADYVVVKNRLVLRALEEMDLEVPDLTSHLTGPTAVVISSHGPVEPAKALAEFAKQHGDRPVFKVGVLDLTLVEPEQFDRLARLPGREQLLAELAGALQGPMAALAMALEGKIQEMAGLLDALHTKKAEEA
jgi:large subunit ribosomal protein L10